MRYERKLTVSFPTGCHGQAGFSRLSVSGRKHGHSRRRRGAATAGPDRGTRAWGVTANSLKVVLLGFIIILAGCSAVMRPAAWPGGGQVIDDPEQSLADAVALVAEQRVAEALPRLRRLIDVFETPETADAPRAAEATFWLGYCHETPAHLEEAMALYRRVIDRYRGTPAAEQAARRLENLQRMFDGPTDPPAT